LGNALLSLQATRPSSWRCASPSRKRCALLLRQPPRTTTKQPSVSAPVLDPRPDPLALALATPALALAKKVLALVVRANPAGHSISRTLRPSISGSPQPPPWPPSLSLSPRSFPRDTCQAGEADPPPGRDPPLCAATNLAASVSRRSARPVSQPFWSPTVSAAPTTDRAAGADVAPAASASSVHTDRSAAHQRAGAVAAAAPASAS
jgi:hypothetical protein